MNTAAQIDEFIHFCRYDFELNKSASYYKKYVKGISKLNPGRPTKVDKIKIEYYKKKQETKWMKKYDLTYNEDIFWNDVRENLLLEYVYKK